MVNKLSLEEGLKLAEKAERWGLDTHSFGGYVFGDIDGLTVELNMHSLSKPVCVVYSFDIHDENDVSLMRKKFKETYSRFEQKDGPIKKFYESIGDTQRNVARSPVKYSLTKARRIISS
jgi:hypothetical protein